MTREKRKGKFDSVKLWRIHPMKTKKLTPRNAAPVQRENTATLSRDVNAIVNEITPLRRGKWTLAPFAGDDAE